MRSVIEEDNTLGIDKIVSQQFEIGKIIARMHLVTKKMKIYRKNSMGIKNLDPLLKSIKLFT